MACLLEPFQLGRRKQYLLAILDGRGSYPRMRFETPDVLYSAVDDSLVYTVVPMEEPNEYGFSEIAWTNLDEIRLWGAIAFAIKEGEGFYSFYPLDNRQVFSASANPKLAEKIARRASCRLPPQDHALTPLAPSAEEVGLLYSALCRADNILLRGVSCYRKSHMLWKHPFFMEEMGINLYIALEAGLSVLRRRLGEEAGSIVPFRFVFDFVRKTFAHGDALAEFWEDCHDDRNMLIHPDSDLGAYALHPMVADDIYELLDPMLSLYRYILIGEPRPVFGKG